MSQGQLVRPRIAGSPFFLPPKPSNLALLIERLLRQLVVEKFTKDRTHAVCVHSAHHLVSVRRMPVL